MRLYTRTGDGGETGLIGGARVAKDSARVAAYGEIDETNAAIGLALATECRGELRAALERLQSDLFTLGADLASEPGSGPASVPRVTREMVERLEHEIDRFEAAVPPLHHFVLPGGTVAAASLHLARSVCRRAERRIVELARSEAVGADVIPYVNRLSDLLRV